MPKKGYLVVGPHTVLGAKPGEEVKADLTEEQEYRLVKAGHLKPVTKKKEEKNDG